MSLNEACPSRSTRLTLLRDLRDPYFSRNELVSAAVAQLFLASHTEHVPCGFHRTNLHVPFLNFMSIIADKAGEVHVRVGGNTQDTAYMVDELPDGRFLEKNQEDASNPVCS